jgi:hypothetical protein
MLVGAVFSFAAAMTAFFGLRHAPIAQHAQEQSPVMVEA